MTSVIAGKRGSGDREIVHFWRFSSHLRPSEYFRGNFIKKTLFKLFLPA
jgi:hypothetical protein